MVRSRFGNTYRWSVLVLVLLLGVVLVADQVLAAPGGNNKGGKGKKGGNGGDNQIQVQLVANPTSCAQGQGFTLHGSGFQPGKTVVVATKQLCAGGTVWNWSWWTGAVADASGSVSIDGTAWQCIGTTEFKAAQFVDGTTYSAMTSIEIY